MLIPAESSVFVDEAQENIVVVAVPVVVVQVAVPHM